MFKLKSTHQQVFDIGGLHEGRAVPDGYVQVLRPFAHVSRAGNRGEVILVRRDRLEKVER